MRFHRTGRTRRNVKMDCLSLYDIVHPGIVSPKSHESSDWSPNRPLNCSSMSYHVDGPSTLSYRASLAFTCPNVSYQFVSPVVISDTSGVTVGPTADVEPFRSRDLDRQTSVFGGKESIVAFRVFLGEQMSPWFVTGNMLPAAMSLASKGIVVRDFTVAFWFPAPLCPPPS